MVTLKVFSYFLLYLVSFAYINYFRNVLNDIKCHCFFLLLTCSLNPVSSTVENLIMLDSVESRRCASFNSEGSKQMILKVFFSFIFTKQQRERTVSFLLTLWSFEWCPQWLDGWHQHRTKNETLILEPCEQLIPDLIMSSP